MNQSSDYGYRSREQLAELIAKKPTNAQIDWDHLEYLERVYAFGVIEQFTAWIRRAHHATGGGNNDAVREASEKEEERWNAYQTVDALYPMARRTIRRLREQLKTVDGSHDVIYSGFPEVLLSETMTRDNSRYRFDRSASDAQKKPFCADLGCQDRTLSVIGDRASPEGPYSDLVYEVLAMAGDQRESLDPQIRVALVALMRDVLLKTTARDNGVGQMQFCDRFDCEYNGNEMERAVRSYIDLHRASFSPLVHRDRVDKRDADMWLMADPAEAQRTCDPVNYVRLNLFPEWLQNGMSGRKLQSISEVGGEYLFAAHQVYEQIASETDMSCL